VRLAAQALGMVEGRRAAARQALRARGDAPRSVDLGRVASVAAMATAAHGVAPGLEATQYFQPPDIAYSSGAHVALVEVDPETGAVRLSATGSVTTAGD
jgi:carbon-monoxide dehydrogenase large subunit